jgi:ParB family chromosome partitioning protein
MGEGTGMKGRDALRDMMSGKTTETVPVAPKRSSGAIRAMNLELQHLSDEAAAAKALRQTLAGSEPVLELAASDIDPSPVVDRIPTDNDPAFEALKTQIAEVGQQVPILVRPHPERQGRYQVAYGRRRLRVASELGRPVKAIIRQLSDRDLIMAQAQENGPRVDLTFIERALFASNLLENGFDKDTIATALGVDKPELSRLLTVATAITPALIAAIGPAPKIGRPRWSALADKCSDPKTAARAVKTTATDEFKRADTNSRFNIVLAAVADEATSPANKTALKTDDGQQVAWVERTKKGIRVTSDQASFAAFLEQRLPVLLKEFAAAEADAQSYPKKGGGQTI